MKVTYQGYLKNDNEEISYSLRVSGIIQNSMDVDYMTDDMTRKIPAVNFYGNDLLADLNFSYSNPNENCNIAEKNLPAEGSLYIFADSTELLEAQKKMAESYTNYNPHSGTTPNIAYKDPALKYFSFKGGLLNNILNECMSRNMNWWDERDVIDYRTNLILPASSNSFSGSARKDIEGGYIEIEWEFAGM